jgi:hypothetical protein
VGDRGRASPVDAEFPRIAVTKPNLSVKLRQRSAWEVVIKPSGPLRSRHPHTGSDRTRLVGSAATAARAHGVIAGRSLVRLIATVRAKAAAGVNKVAEADMGEAFDQR